MPLLARLEVVPFPVLPTDPSRYLSPDMHHCPRRLNKIRLADVVARFFSLDNPTDELHEIVIRSSAAHQFMQVVVPNGEQAGANLAVGGDADAAAMAAEGMRNRRDDSNFANAIVKTITASRLAACVRDFDKRPIICHAAQDFVESDNCFRGPNPVFLKRHELDEAHDHALFSREHSEGND